MNTVQDILSKITQIDTVLSRINDSRALDDEDKIVYKLSLCDMDTVRSVFDAYKDILLKMEIKENE